MWTLFSCLYIISSVLHNNIFLVFFFQSQQYVNFICSHMNHSFQWESRYIWAFLTHLYTCRIRKSPKWLVYLWPLHLSHLWLTLHEASYGSFGLLVGKWRKNCWAEDEITALLYFHTEGTTTPMCENKQMYKWQAENLILPLMECYLLVSNGDKASLWHKVTSLTAYRTQLNAAPMPDFLPTVRFLSSWQVENSGQVFFLKRL